MDSATDVTTRFRPMLAFGPKMPQNGSWHWIGEDLAREALQEFDITTWECPVADCDVLVVVKYPLPPEVLAALPERIAVIYFPVDFFQSEEHLASAAYFLVRCNRILVSSASLKPLFECHARTELLEHHVKYILPRMLTPKEGGFVLWTGVRDNIAPLAAWVNSCGLAEPLVILTNPETDRPTGEEFGFRDCSNVVIERWTPQRHLSALQAARAAIDVKGNEFAQRHKPPTKVADYLAAGLPTAINPHCGPADFLRKLGLDVASPNDVEKWFSDSYAEECLRVGSVLREHLNVHRVGHRFRGIVRNVIAEVHRGSHAPSAQSQRSFPKVRPPRPRQTRVAIVSFLFNWPSTGGGIIHTIELGTFLARDGFDILHIYARAPQWGIGRVDSDLPYPGKALDFSGQEPKLEPILSVFQEAVRQFNPDHVIITDSWNIKPWLAQAVNEFPYILRFQALECLCPLNNIRFLPQEGGRFAQCGKHQMATPELCHACVSTKGHLSGVLHQWERTLCQVGSQQYDRALRIAINKAEAVLVVNPDMATMLAPYSDRVHVVPSGFDPERFPRCSRERSPGPYRILFAGLASEWIKGFSFAREACKLLWNSRQDFELWVTDEPVSNCEPFIRFVGWQSQVELAKRMQESDLVIVPTIAQDALGRTAVEAMAASRAVVASRIGGLRSTVLDGCTGLLAEPGEPFDLASKIGRLLDDPQLRERLGQSGRERFEEIFTWDVIISRYYRPLLTATAT